MSSGSRRSRHWIEATITVVLALGAILSWVATIIEWVTGRGRPPALLPVALILTILAGVGMLDWMTGWELGAPFGWQAPRGRGRRRS